MLDIKDELMKKMKQFAAAVGRTVTKITKSFFRRKVPARKRFRLDWTTVSGHLPPSIDPADRDALIEHMEGRS
jgi:hypothetical protein